MTGHGAKFGRKQEDAIVALLANRTIEEAARAVGISPKTLLPWMKEPTFDAAYRSAKRAAYAQSIARLHRLASAAVSTLGNVMQAAETPPATKVRAADSILDHTAKSIEIEEVEARVAALEHGGRERKATSMKAIVGRLRKLEAEALLTARPGEVRSKLRHVIKFIGDGPPSEPRCSPTLYSTGHLFEQVIIHERHPLMTDEAAMDRFVASCPITSVQAVSWRGSPAMRSIERRVHKLEDRLGVTNNQPEIRVWVFKSGTELTQAHRDVCRRVLDELGFADCTVMNLGDMPYRLSVQEMDRFVRENAAKICQRRQ